MGIRETLNRNPAITTGGTVLIIILALGAILWQTIGGRPHISDKAYYSSDDGQTYFSDKLTQIPPFDHGGQPAVRAYVFSCGGNKFVAYLEKYNEKSKAALDKSAAANNGVPAADALENAQADGLVVKKPGGSKWVLESDDVKSRPIMEVKCPNGGTDTPIPVLP